MAAAPGQDARVGGHRQGHRKIYTLIVTGKRIIEDPALASPAVLLPVNPNGPEAQLSANLEAVGFGRVGIVITKAHLRKLLSQAIEA